MPNLNELHNNIRKVFGVNLVMCCNCSYPLAHKVEDAELLIKCPECGLEISVNECCDIDY